MVIQRLGMRPMKDARPIIMIMRRDRPRVEQITSISAAPDDLRSRSRTAAVHSLLFACIDQHVDQSMFHCLLCLNQCALACASTASMFASNQTACQRKKTSPVENLCSSPVKPTATPPHSPCSSTSKLLEDHKCFFSQALHSRRSW